MGLANRTALLPRARWTTAILLCARRATVFLACARRATVFLACAGLATTLAGCGSEPEEVSDGYAARTLLAGRANEFSAYSKSAILPGPRVLVVSGIVGDMPGLSQAVDSVRNMPLAAGSLTLVPRANVSAISAGERSPGGELNEMFGPYVEPEQRDVVTSLQLLADSSDVLIVLTDQTEDYGHSLFYSPEAPVATVAVAQDIAGSINEELDRLAGQVGYETTEIYALRSGRPNTFIGWAAERDRPRLALEFGLFGGRDHRRAGDAQPGSFGYFPAHLMLTVALAELGVLDRSAIDQAGRPPEAPASDAASDSPALHLRYSIDGDEQVHMPGDLFAVPEGSHLRVQFASDEAVGGVNRLDVVGVGGEDDTGRDIDLTALGEPPFALDLRYLDGDIVVWREPIIVGEGSSGGRFVLQDTLGTHPFLASFPEPEAWFYLSETRIPSEETTCAACDLPAGLQLAAGPDLRIVGTPHTLRSYRLTVGAEVVGALYVPRWSDTGADDLVDITDANRAHGLTPGVAVDMRYATADNFLHANVYEDMNRCLLRRDVAEALARVQRSLQARGLGLKVYDCYRPHAVQYRMWEIMPEPGYVANPATGSNHNRGAAVDVTLVNADGSERAMPTAFDDFSRAAWHETSEGLTPEQIENRGILREAMAAEGFSPIRKEWWHYNGPDFRSYTENLDVALDAGYRRMPLPPDWHGPRFLP